MTGQPAALRRWAVGVLADAGIDSAAADAAQLLAHVLGTDPGRLILVDEVAAADEAAFRSLIEQRAQRIPLQHLTSRAWFGGVELTVGPGVFIPRPETELIAAWAVAEIAAREGDAPVLVADLCTGSGALALAVAAGAPRAQVVAVERSPAAFEYLRRNIAAQPQAVAERVRAVQADVTDTATMAPLLDGYALIIANPPYVPAASPVSAEVAADPAEAVFSGDTGMDVISALAPLIGTALAPGGATAIEHDDTTAEQVVAALAAQPRLTGVAAHDDLAGRPRFVTARARTR